MIFNITKNWTSFFETRSNAIIESPKSTFLCQFAAKRWRQIHDDNFFYNTWMPNAVSCSKYLIEARKGMMCALCDKREQGHFTNEASSEIQGINVPSVNFSFSTCTAFIGACMGAMESKRYVLDKMNVEYTLALCDKEGKYLAEGDKTHYKKTLKSSVMFEDENFHNCKLFLSRDKSQKKPEYEIYEKACLDICKLYFSLSGLHYDDFDNLDNFKYQHDILRDIVMDQFHPNLFNIREDKMEAIAMDFHEVVFKFENSSAPQQNGLDLEKHMKDNGYKAFPVENFLRYKAIAVSSLAFLITIIPLL